MSALRIGRDKVWLDEPDRSSVEVTIGQAHRLILVGGVSEALSIRQWPRWFTELEKEGVRVEQVPPLDGPVKHYRFRAPPLPFTWVVMQ